MDLSPPPVKAAEWDRARLATFADGLLTSVRQFASPQHGRITLPGPEGGYGHAIDGLEGFTRTLLLAGFRLAGENGDDPLGLADWYAQGIAAGTDPNANEQERWVGINEHGQAKVEAASLALILDMTRPWIWDRLDARVQENVINYLAPVVGNTDYPINNWCWFRLVVQTFLKSVGGPHSLDDMRADLALHDTFARDGGWMSDGDERSYDHYAGWALHLYPPLWARMKGAEDLAAERGTIDRDRLDAFLGDALALVGADGSPLLQGRSLTYRFAAAAPYWVGALAEVPSHSPGLLRRAATRIVQHFADAGAPTSDGILTIGWHDQWRQIAQSYTGPSSPYWASKGLLGLALPANHPVWTAPSQPLPIESDTILRASQAPGWIISGTPDDGIVRVLNHGTDHACTGDDSGDSPLYARLGYSTATSPLLDDAGWASPDEQSVTLVDANGRASHRSGFDTLGVRIDGEPSSDTAVGVGATRVAAHWIDLASQQTLHGSGWTGQATPAGTLTVISLVRGAYEARLVRVDALASGVIAADATLRISGWPVVDGDGLTSTVTPALGSEATAGQLTRDNASPMGSPSRVPYLDYPVTPGTWTSSLVGLTRDTAAVDAAATATITIDPTSRQAHVTWPDGAATTTNLTDTI
ncbi:MAG: DUF2264 domain-containing protein [Cellulomonadaceae bacterium]|nr:DUF2264 domain-containing protein [Cellulomonadaceae bacterium]